MDEQQPVSHGTTQAEGDVETEPAQQPEPIAPARQPLWRRPAVIAPVAVVAVACAVVVGILIGRGGASTPPSAASTSASTPIAAQSCSPPADAPAQSECTLFAQVYNGQLSPALKAPSNGANNVFWMTQADAFQALVNVLSTGADPYSQTLAHDATTVAASDREYDADGSAYGALGNFNTDLKPFLDKCNMSGN